ncbi:MAG: CBS domain-containing protein [Gemmatimonadetes bacterium]|nr:CBS domain-containing protein [Gemmatimonadota bacterium]
MTANVLTIRPYHSVERARKLMDSHQLSALPVVDSDDLVVGMVSSSDLVRTNGSENSPVRTIMSTRVFTISEYDAVHSVARMMRNRHIHHVVVTNEKRVVGMISSYDLLRLVENHRFVMRNAPNGPRGKHGTG